MRLLHSPTQNKILGALPDEEYRRLLPFLELVDMPLGQVIHEPGTRPRQLYFPATCIVARIYELRSGITRRVSMTGNEGVTDIFLLLGCDSTAATVIVQNPGYGYRIKAKILKQEFEAGGPLQQLLLRFSQALLCQTEQTAVEACQSVEQKLCRFFLMILDRLATDSIAMTHEFVSNMLGVRRERVAMTAKRMRTRGWITYQDGTVVVLNRAALEGCVCECYEVVNAEYRRLFQRKRKKRGGARRLR